MVNRWSTEQEADFAHVILEELPDPWLDPESLANVNAMFIEETRARLSSIGFGVRQVDQPLTNGPDTPLEPLLRRRSPRLRAFVSA